jgi:hypothetical protein
MATHPHLLFPFLADGQELDLNNLEVYHTLINLGTLSTPSGIIGRIKMFDPIDFSGVLW